MPVAFKYLMIRGSAIHIAYRILAAFFIDMGAKTSIVENLRFINLKIIYLVFYNVQSRSFLLIFQLVISSIVC